MDAKTREFVIEKTNELINAYSCSKEAKDAAQAWLKAAGTPNEAEETRKYVTELEEDILPIDALIAFTASDAGKQLFGEENAKKANAHGLQIKAEGAKYCDCPACTAVAAILSKKEDLLG